MKDLCPRQSISFGNRKPWKLLLCRESVALLISTPPSDVSQIPVLYWEQKYNHYFGVVLILCPFSLTIPWHTQALPLAIQFEDMYSILEKKKPNDEMPFNRFVQYYLNRAKICYICLGCIKLFNCAKNVSLLFLLYLFNDERMYI